MINFLFFFGNSEKFKKSKIFNYFRVKNDKKIAKKFVNKKLRCIENKLQGSGQGSSNKSSKAVREDDLDIFNGLKMSKVLSRKISLDSDQKIEGCDPFSDGSFDKQITLKGLNEDLTESYEGGKQIFESLIEIPPDSTPIMQTQHYEDGNKYEGELVKGFYIQYIFFTIFS